MRPPRNGKNLVWRYLGWSLAFNLGTAAALLAFASWRGRRPAPESRASRPALRALRGWDISPGESLLPNGERDLVLEASLESFPASDPPAVSPRR